MAVKRVRCAACDLTVDGTFEISPFALLPAEDQIFVTAFVRYHGSIKKMEELFEISYPTVKNRLNAIGAALDQSIKTPSPNSALLEQLSTGEITVAEALKRMT
jgi:hypothetical protein